LTGPAEEAKEILEADRDRALDKPYKRNFRRDRDEREGGEEFKDAPVEEEVIPGLTFEEY